MLQFLTMSCVDMYRTVAVKRYKNMTECCYCCCCCCSIFLELQVNGLCVADAAMVLVHTLRITWPVKPRGKKQGKIQCFFSGFRLHGNHSGLCHVTEAGPVTMVTDGESGQGLGRF